MNYIQNQKIMQVKETTLVVGVDIAKHTHVARAQDFRGIQYGKPISFSNSRLGFNQFLHWIKEMNEEQGKSEVIVGMEPTGHYWLPLEQYLKGQEGVKTVVVNPAHVKKSKTLDDNSPTKTDKKDARVIAQLVKDGRYSTPHMPEGVYAELRVAMTHRERLNKDLIRIKAKAQQWIDKYFPEFYLVFKSWEGKAALAVLKEIPLPAEIAAMSPEEIVGVFKKGAERAVGIKRAKKLKGVALKTVGLSEGLSMAKLEIINLLEQYELMKNQLEILEDKIEKLLPKVPGAKEMGSIKGVGAMTIAGFISEVGDVRNYSHPRQIQKLAGLNLMENSSGKHKGQTRISKRGRPKLRALLYRVMMPLVAKNDEFKQLHKYYITRSENPLKKKQSLIALACKLIRVLYALGKKQVKYDGNRLIQDIIKNQDISIQEAA
jgi:transposase